MSSQSDRDARILELMPLVRSLAARYARRGEPLEDLVQVGTIGLIKAVDRFDPDRGVDIASFATPTILGEIRRHFRDRAWMVHVPRGLQESHRTVAGAIDEVAGALGRSPTIAEVARHTGMSPDEVLDAIAVAGAYRPTSLVTGGDDDDENTTDIAIEDEAFARADARAILSDRLGDLPDREQLILALRFARGLTQSEIAAKVGVSQMHVSRLIAKSLRTLRDTVGDADPTAG
jgi:RNA polymerase sigma-B factor